MSGIFLSSSGIDFATNAGARLAFTDNTALETGVISGLAWAVTRVDSMALWGPAYDEISGVQVLLGGRVSFDEADWNRAENTPYQGGLACRRLLDAWLNRRNAFTSELNGAFLVVVIEPRENLVHVFTDRLGVYPIYDSPGAPLTLCSHPDVLADDLISRNKPCDIDWTTVAECLGTASGVQPYTYYRQIEQLEPASHYVWQLSPEPNLKRCSSYWEPAYLTEEPSGNAEVLSDELATALKNAARRRTLPRFGKAAVMLSGGADSRTALFGACDPSKVTCFTLFDEPNPELHTARKLAKIAGAKHVPLQRDIEYYGNSVEEAVRIAGGMWSIEDSHFLGHLKSITSSEIDTVLTGCYADWMFKGIMFNRKPRKLFGRNLPLYDFAPFGFDYYQPHTALSMHWADRVQARLTSRYPESYRAAYSDNYLQIENLRLRPLSREENTLGRMTLLRTLPWDPLLADTEIISAYERISPEFKINGRVFGSAVGKVIGKQARGVKNSNYGTPVDANELERAAWFVLGVIKRKIARLVNPTMKEYKLATTGSWPNWEYLVAHSKKLEGLWGSPSIEERQLFLDILGYDPWGIPIERWAVKDHFLFSRIITLKTWLRQRKL